MKTTYLCVQQKNKKQVVFITVLKAVKQEEIWGAVKIFLIDYIYIYIYLYMSVFQPVFNVSHLPVKSSISPLKNKMTR